MPFGKPQKGSASIPAFGPSPPSDEPAGMEKLRQRNRKRKFEEDKKKNNETSKRLKSFNKSLHKYLLTYFPVEGLLESLSDSGIYQFIVTKRLKDDQYGKCIINGQILEFDKEYDNEGFKFIINDSDDNKCYDGHVDYGYIQNFLAKQVVGEYGKPSLERGCLRYYWGPIWSGTGFEHKHYISCD